MTIYIKDFRDDPADQQPEGWTKLWNIDNATAIVRSSNAAFSGKWLEVKRSAPPGFGFVLDAVDADTNSADIEVLTRGTTNAMLLGTGLQRGICVRAISGIDETYYAFSLNENTKFRVSKNISGAFAALQEKTLSSLGLDSLLDKEDAFLWMRFRVNGTSLKAKVWLYGTPEPLDWQFDLIDTSLTDGSAGVLISDVDPTNYYDYIAFATGGETAPIFDDPWVNEKEPPSFLNVIRHLLPNAKAWWLTPEKNLKKFFRGLSDMPQDIRDFYDLIFNDLDPQKTRQLDEWEEQFGLPPSFLDEQERRDRLEATWKNQGGQSPYYIQTTLQNAGFNVFVHEWWEEGTDPPVARDPTTLLSGSEITYLMMDGALIAQDGNTDAMDGKAIGLRGYPLVNKPEPSGGYTVPSDPNTFPYYWYVGSETFPEVANVPQSRRDEFEQLLLKIGPTHLWIGVLVEYT
jgi:uncharacterized protein YmfQ (DUF2313 family)